MIYKTVKIVKEETYRDKPTVNMTDNYVRVTITCSRNEWSELRRHLLTELPITPDSINMGHGYWQCGECREFYKLKECADKCCR